MLMHAEQVLLTANTMEEEDVIISNFSTAGDA